MPQVVLAALLLLQALRGGDGLCSAGAWRARTSPSCRSLGAGSALWAEGQGRTGQTGKLAGALGVLLSVASGQFPAVAYGADATAGPAVVVLQQQQAQEQPPLELTSSSSGGKASAGASVNSEQERQIESIQISPLEKELQDFEEDLEMAALMQRREPKRLMSNLKTKLARAVKLSSAASSASQALENARERVLTLKAYLDEVERDLFAKNWGNLQVYLYTFADQEDAFAMLIEGLFPNDNPLDKSAREAMAFEAQSMFLSLDQLREAARVASPERARSAYSRLLLSYDRFLKAGDLYPTYDPITSTAIFFANTPQSTLRFDGKAKVQVLDSVLLTAGPDMGKTGTVINIDGSNAIVKLDKDGKAYQEVKFVRLEILAKTVTPEPAPGTAGAAAGAKAGADPVGTAKGS